MRGPPRWLPWLGPPLAGLTVAVADRVLVWPSFAVVVGLGLIAGFAPILADRIWKWRADQRR